MAHCLDSLIYMQRHKDMLEEAKIEPDPQRRAAMEDKAFDEMMRAIRFHEQKRAVRDGPARKANQALKQRMGSEASVLDHVEVRHHVPLCSKNHAVDKDAPKEPSNAADWKRRQQALKDKQEVDHTPRRRKKARPNEPIPESIVCEHCNKVGTLAIDVRQAQQVCTSCGDVTPWHDERGAAAQHRWLGTSVMKGGSYSYKRQNHLFSWILRIQAKESTAVPEEHMAAVRGELEKMQLSCSDPTKVTPKRVRAILKKLKLPKYYNSVHMIRYLVCGHRPPQMTEEQEREVMSMFDDVVDIYTTLQKRGVVKRSNMLSYSYTLMKMLELLGPEYDKFLPQLTLLKHRERLRDQEEIWRLVCEASGEFLEQPFAFHSTTMM